MNFGSSNFATGSLLFALFAIFVFIIMAFAHDLGKFSKESWEKPLLRNLFLTVVLSTICIKLETVLLNVTVHYISLLSYLIRETFLALGGGLIGYYLISMFIILGFCSLIVLSVALAYRLYYKKTYPYLTETSYGVWILVMVSWLTI